MGDSPNPFGTTLLLPPEYMIGAIIIWSGAIADIPADWQLCDGTNGTPDLRNRFVHGALNEGQVGASGGNLTHTHPFTGDGHVHDIDAGVGYAGAEELGHRDFTTSKEAGGTTDAANHLPPYYCLAYIQRMT